MLNQTEHDIYLTNIYSSFIYYLFYVPYSAHGLGMLIGIMEMITNLALEPFGLPWMPQTSNSAINSVFQLNFPLAIAGTGNEKER